MLVIKDAHYPWLLLVPRREGAVEIIDLDEVEQAQLMTEVSRVARALKEVTKCDKLNIAALGNMVPQLHVHVIARRTSDATSERGPASTSSSTSTQRGEPSRASSNTSISGVSRERHGASG